MTMDAKAAVAVIIAAKPQPSILLLRRRALPGDPWSGHFAFPGGRRDEEDANLLSTCLRETREETGIVLPEDALRQALPAAPVGKLMRIHMLVQPYLFQVGKRPEVAVDPGEIESAHWLEVAAFRDGQRHRQREIIPGIHLPTFPLEDYYLWGFTYGVLRRLFDDTGW
jgi:8-oxo-dGTP pyrophosphatase MutT (NUDIX family)